MSAKLLLSKPHKDITEQFNFDSAELFSLFGAADVKMIALEKDLTASEFDQVLASKNCFKLYSVPGGLFDGKRTHDKRIALPTVAMGSLEYLILYSDVPSKEDLTEKPHKQTLVMDIKRLGSNKDASKQKVEGKYYVDPSYIEQMNQALHKP